MRRSGRAIRLGALILLAEGCDSAEWVTPPSEDASIPSDNDASIPSGHDGSNPLSGHDASAGMSGAVWTVSEFSFTAQKSYSNPYTDVTFTATFTPPSGSGGVTRTVPGFWDGGQSFRVRFTPDVAGTWTFTTSATPADPGLTESGSLSVGAAPAGNHGFARVDPHNVNAFLFDDGTRYFMWGQTYYEVVRTARAGSNWQKGVDGSKSYGLNKVRMLIYPWNCGQNTDPNSCTASDGNTYPASRPFVSDTDHDHLDLAHWHALDAIVQYLESREMLADLILFSDSPTTYGTNAQDQRYVQYVLARYAAYHNVIWCLANEWEYGPHGTSPPPVGGYWDDKGGILRSQDKWFTAGGASRLLSSHQQTRIDFEFFGTNRWPAHAIIQFGERNGNGPNDPPHTANPDQWGNSGIVFNRGHGIPVVNDEYGFLNDLTQTGHRQAMWAIVTGGGFGSTGDGTHVGTAPVWLTGDWVDEPSGYGDVQRMIQFWTTRGIPYFRMTPQNSLVSPSPRNYLLADAGSTYVVYSAMGGSFTVNLPSGMFQQVIYNPRDGSTSAPVTVAGGNHSFSMPDAQNDWVLLLTATK